MLIFLKLLFIVLLIQSGCAEKIGLFVSTETEQQQAFGYNFANVLSSDHEVVIVRVSNTDDKNVPLENIRELLLPLSSSKSSGERKSMSVDLENNCIALFNNTQAINAIEKENFDYAIAQDNQLCSFAIFEKVKIPKYSWVSSTGLTIPMALAHGVSLPSLSVTSSPKKSYIQRVIDFATLISNRQHAIKLFSQATFLAKQSFGDSFPDVFELAEKSQLLFINDFEAVFHSVPLPASVIHIGGLKRQSITSSDPNVAKFSHLNVQMPGGKVRPLILVNLDEQTSKDFKHVILDFMRKNIQADFMWQIDDSTIDTYIPRNVFKQKNLPIAELLSHSRTTAFISDCNWEALQRSIVTASPIICVPVTEEQQKNAKLAESRGIGLTLQNEAVTIDSLTNVLKVVLENLQLATSIKSLQKRIQERPLFSEELLKKNLQYALHNDFNFAAPTIGIVEYYNLDVVVPFGFITLAVSSVILKFILGLYYWSCFGMSFREKTKLQ